MEFCTLCLISESSIDGHFGAKSSLKPHLPKNAKTCFYLISGSVCPFIDSLVHLLPKLFSSNSFGNLSLTWQKKRGKNYTLGLLKLVKKKLSLVWRKLEKSQFLKDFFRVAKCLKLKIHRNCAAANPWIRFVSITFFIFSFVSANALSSFWGYTSWNLNWDVI